MEIKFPLKEGLHSQRISDFWGWTGLVTVTCPQDLPIYASQPAKKTTVFRNQSEDSGSTSSMNSSKK